MLVNSPEVVVKHVCTKILGISFPDHVSAVSRSALFNNENQTLMFTYNDGSDPIEVNVYEMIHRMKEYAKERKYSIMSGPDYTDTGDSYVAILNEIGGKSEDTDEFIGTTEFGVVMAAVGEVILDEQGNLHKEEEMDYE